MDTTLLSKMLRELIAANATVSLPGIGEFVAMEMPASFSDKGYTINPPYLKLSFLRNSSDDGLLTDLYARSNAINTAAAKAIVRAYVAELSSVLSNTGTIVFPGLGRLRLTRSGSLLFIQDEDADIYPDGFGLEPVHLKNHTAAPGTEQIPATDSTLEPEAVTEAETDAVTEAETDAEPEPEPEAATTAEPEKEQVQAKPKKHFRWGVLVISLIIASLMALAVFLVLAQVAPEFIDSILYTPEELEIINS